MALAEEAFRSAWEEGQAIGFEKAFDLFLEELIQASDLPLDSAERSLRARTNIEPQPIPDETYASPTLIAITRPMRNSPYKVKKV